MIRRGLWKVPLMLETPSLAEGKVRVRAGSALACAVAVCLLSGCTPPVEDKQSYSDTMQAERQVRESIRKTLNGETEDQGAIRMVREHAAPEGDGTTDEWLKRVLDAEDGTILFPLWQAQRRGVGRYEVWHVYTLLAEDSRVEEKGHAWIVDLALKLVEGPRPLTPREIGADSPRYYRGRAQRTAQPVELIQD